jgi:excisionase family DNA binding protein
VSTTVPQRFLLTVAETAAKLNVSEKTVRRLIAKGSLPALRVGGAVRVDPLELELWLDQMSTVGLDSAVPSTAASFTRVERHEHCA